MEHPGIDAIIKRARQEVERRSQYLGPTVLAGAVVLHAVRYLRRHADVASDGELEAWVAELERIGTALWDWRPRGLAPPPAGPRAP